MAKKDIDPIIQNLFEECKDNRENLYELIKKLTKMSDDVTRALKLDNIDFKQRAGIQSRIFGCAELWKLVLAFRNELRSSIEHEIGMRMKMVEDDKQALERLKILASEMFKKAVDMEIPVSLGEVFYDEDYEINKSIDVADVAKLKEDSKK